MLIGLSNHTKGVLLCLIGVLILTPDTLLIRKAGDSIPTPTLLFYRYGSHACSVLCFVIASERRNAIDNLRHMGIVGVVAGIILGASNIFFTMAIEYTVVANVLVILSSNPMFSAFFSWVLVGDVIRRRTVVAMIVCLGAIALIFYDQVGGDGSGRAVAGNVLAVCAAVSLGLFFAIVHYAEKKNQSDISMIPCNIVAGIFIVIVSSAMGAAPGSRAVWAPPAETLLFLALQGLLVMPVSFCLFTLAPRFISAPEVSLFFLIETCLGPLWVWLGGYEAPPALTVYGGSVLIIALSIHSYLSIREGEGGDAPPEPGPADAGRLELGACARAGETELVECADGTAAL